MRVNQFNIQYYLKRMVLFSFLIIISLLLIGIFLYTLKLFNLIQIINEYNSILMLIFTGVVGASTLVYAYLTLNLIDETKKARESQMEPRIAVYLHPRGGNINLVDTIIENNGTGPAEKITLIPDRDFVYHTTHKMFDLGAFKYGINYLAPNSKIVLFTTIFVGEPKNGEKIKTKINIKIKYKDYLGNDFEENDQLNYSEYEDYVEIGKPPLVKIVDKLDEIGDKINSLDITIKNLKDDNRE